MDDEKICLNCGGIGWNVCIPCRGTGKHISFLKTYDTEELVKCQWCNGTGKKRCGRCYGTGYITEEIKKKHRSFLKKIEKYGKKIS